MAAEVGVVHHQLLAESVDETARAAGYAYAQRVGRLNAHGVAYRVAPQSVGGGDEQRISAALLHLPCRYGVGIAFAALVERHELIEHSCVEQQEHI